MNPPKATVLPALRAVSCAAITGTMYGAASLRMRAAPVAERPVIWDRWFRQWARHTARLTGLDPWIEGPLPRPPTGPRLVVSNHRTAADIPILFGMFGGRILSRADVERWPVLGPLAARAGTLFVDRESGSSGAAAIRMIRRALRERHTVILFPEGTTYPGDEVRPFFAGAFAAARGVGAEVIPVGLAYPPGMEWWQQSLSEHFRTLAAGQRTRVGVALGNPRPLEGKPDAVAVQLRDEVQALVETARSLMEGSA